MFCVFLVPVVLVQYFLGGDVECLDALMTSRCICGNAARGAIH